MTRDFSGTTVPRRRGQRVFRIAVVWFVSLAWFAGYLSARAVDERAQFAGASNSLQRFELLSQAFFDAQLPGALLSRIEIHPRNRYDAELHRLLQLAANIVDAMTNHIEGEHDFPSVFRPVFTNDGRRIAISGYVEAHDASFVESRWLDLAIDADRAALRDDFVRSNANVFGVPVVIGAKKGFPNFNEFSFQTAAVIARRLAIRKPATNDFTPDPAWQTNQLYVLSVSNVFGLEAWNSYTQDFRRAFELRVTNYYTLGVDHVAPGTTNRETLRSVSGILSTTITDAVWSNRLTPEAFRVLATNVVALESSAYLSEPPWFTNSAGTNVFSPTPPFLVPQWITTATNRITYVLNDVESGRLIDFVNLDNVVSYLDLSRASVGTNWDDGGPVLDGPSISLSAFWKTNRVGTGTIDSPTIGITNQLGVSLGVLSIGASLWRDWTLFPFSGIDKDKAIDTFRRFMGLRQLTTNRVPAPAALWLEAPFAPVRMMTHRITWQANDPLVHFHVEDLTDRVLTLTNNFAMQSPRSPLRPANLGLLNERYNPWGGNPTRSTGDPTAFDYRLKDPLVRRSDDWAFPSGEAASLTWIGRIHRGTPWQTVYLKAIGPDSSSWEQWAGNAPTQYTVRSAARPETDRRLVAALMRLFPRWPLNQRAGANDAALPRVIVGFNVLTNVTTNPRPDRQPVFQELQIEAESPQLASIAAGLERTRAAQPGGRFQLPTDLLATPELTVWSPFLFLPFSPRTPTEMSAATLQYLYAMTDEAMERIPSQLLERLQGDAAITVRRAGDRLVLGINELRGSSMTLERSRDLREWNWVLTKAISAETDDLDLVPTAEAAEFYRVKIIP